MGTLHLFTSLTCTSSSYLTLTSHPFFTRHRYKHAFYLLPLQSLTLDPTVALIGLTVYISYAVPILYRENRSTLIFDSQSTMSATTKLDLVHLPCDNSPINMKTIALVDIDPGGFDKHNYKDFEKKLRHIPDVQLFPDFGWAHRILAVLSKENLGKGVRTWPEEDYLLYVCMDEESGLMQNWRVQDILTAYGGKDAPRVFPTKAYGDAFVFKMKPRSKTIESGPAEYIHMLPSFVSSATVISGTGAVEAIWNLLYLAAQLSHVERAERGKY